MSNYEFIAVKHISLLAFLQYVERHPANSTTIVICSSKEEFEHVVRSQLLGEQGVRSVRNDNSLQAISQSALLLPDTLSQISTALKSTTAFIPSVRHFRAFSSALNMPKNDQSSSYHLAIWGISALHSVSIEDSAQGLSRSLACSIDALQRCTASSRKGTITFADNFHQSSSPDGDPSLTHTHVREEAASDWTVRKLPLLNVTSGSNNLAGERLVAGLMVPIAQVFEARSFKIINWHGI